MVCETSSCTDLKDSSGERVPEVRMTEWHSAKSLNATLALKHLRVIRSQRVSTM